MKTSLELLSDIDHPEDVDYRKVWRNRIFAFGTSMGFSHATLAIFPGHETPVAAGNAFLITNLPQDLLNKYDQDKMGEFDPVARHCITRSTAMIWSSGDFCSAPQKRLYEAISAHGIRSGLALPFHGPGGEFGLLSYSSADRLDARGRQAVALEIPVLSCFRDAVMEVFSGVARKSAYMIRDGIEITSREMECLKWCAAGKSSWDIANLMNCSEATVNFHFSNIRRKFGASSRQAAVIKAIRLGFLSL